MYALGILIAIFVYRFVSNLSRMGWASYENRGLSAGLLEMSGGGYC